MAITMVSTSADVKAGRILDVLWIAMLQDVKADPGSNFLAKHEHQDGKKSGGCRSNPVVLVSRDQLDTKPSRLQWTKKSIPQLLHHLSL